MKSVFFSMVVSAALAIPAVSFAQTDIPANAAPAQSQSQAGESSVGGVTAGSAASSSGAEGHSGLRIVDFFRRENAKASHRGTDCVAPASYCSLYFGGS
ncbi:hypothetical protein P3T40_004403 [Paraburkholderia sp. EB58]|jgi:hypothetical protein|uniref:hypothetical protein n=1 Tax=Paraburkholderia sp. EB58 TaxID=3035125 RepID=UPI003D210B3F